jgi:hypothetical protein
LTNSSGIVELTKKLTIGESDVNYSNSTLESINVTQRKIYRINIITLGILEDIFNVCYTAIRKELNIVTKGEFIAIKNQILLFKKNHEDDFKVHEIILKE